jgi:hypothetical protein
MDDERRSPGWVLLLVLLVHLELWLAFGATVVSLVHLQSTGQALGMSLPYATEVVAGLATALMDWPPLLFLFPLVDVAVLVTLHRALPSRAARVAWSAFVAGFLLLLLVWGSAGHGMMLRKLQEALQRPGAPAPGAPAP